MATLNRTAISKAVQTATDRNVLTRIARTQDTIWALEGKPQSGVEIEDLAAAILNNQEMGRIVAWFADAPDEIGIACMIGELIAASLSAARA